MPNQRSPNKVRLGGFVEQRLYRTVVAMARREGFADDKFGFVQLLLRQALAHREKRLRRRAGRRRSTRRLRAAA